MSIVIEIDLPKNIDELPKTYFTSWFHAGIIFNIDGITITKRKGSKGIGYADYLFTTFEIWLKAIPELLKGKEMKCNLVSMQGSFIFKPYPKQNLIDIKAIGSSRTDKKNDLDFEGERKFQKVKLTDFIKQIIKVSTELSEIVKKYNQDITLNPWFNDFQKLISDTTELFLKSNIFQDK